MPQQPDEFSEISGVPLKRSPEQYAESLFQVARGLAVHLKGTTPVSHDLAKRLMVDAFGKTDAEGGWIWKDVYEAQEIAMVMFLHMAKPVMQKMSPDQTIQFLLEKQNLCLTNTFRSEAQQRLQQFSTPLPLGFIASCAAGFSAQDICFEPSAGTGLLATFAKVAGVTCFVNELDPYRTALLKRVFTEGKVSSHDAEYINDCLAQEVVPSVVVMNPPFSRTAGIEKKRPEATLKHLRSALLRLAPGGRLVLISGSNFHPLARQWRDSFIELQSFASVVGSFGIVGAAYAKQGTSFPTRLTIIDKVPAPHAAIFSNIELTELRARELLERVEKLPPRREVQLPCAIIPPPLSSATLESPSSGKRQERTQAKRVKGSQREVKEYVPIYTDIAPVEYETIEIPVYASSREDTLYEEYQPQRIKVVDAKPHPTQLCESAALASVPPPIPTYKPTLPRELIRNGTLSSSQIESVIYAGNAHQTFLDGYFSVDDIFENLTPSTADDTSAVRFRRGWFLGDGTGAGKGRQVAAIILANLLEGRTKAIWVSKSATLIEDARRDWADLGQDPSLIHDLSKWSLSESVTAGKGILFCTYATLRSEKAPYSRLNQIIEWAGGKEFDGVLAFDESHAMGNAAGASDDNSDYSFLEKKASQQGVKGVRLQNALPSARVLYVSATGATSVENLAYATRLGLWGSAEFPFADRSAFFKTVQEGGIAAMEVVCRDLKALGLYLSRSLSFQGVEYEPLKVCLTDNQIQTYNTFARAFQIIHQNIEAALTASNVTSLTGKAQNRVAKMAASSEFEGVKQRFFNHVLTSMKTPELIKSMERDVEAGRSPVVQLVSTNESLTARRIQEIPEEERNNITVDITPIDGVMRYLVSSFPVHLYKEYQDSNGNITSELARDADGAPILCQEAVAMRDALIEKISLLPPLPGALDQILHHFGHEKVAEVTGRSIRILRDKEEDRFYVARRPSGASADETRAFMNGEKLILVFSGAGATGRSYHASLTCNNQRQRVHYLLEAGWRAEEAVQGLGRSHRSNQAHPPIFAPVGTDVKGEERFLSTIARRIASLGALTKGQRQAGGQGIYDDSDNLESRYAARALDLFYTALYGKTAQSVSLHEFEEATGLKLTDSEGYKKETLPSMQTFLNRLLALRIDLQNAIFSEFEDLHRTCIQTALAAGTYETGLETLPGERFTLVSQEVLYEHPATGSATICSEVERMQALRVRTAEEAYVDQAALYVNERSVRAAIQTAAASIFDENGTLVPRIRLRRPLGDENLTVAAFDASTWKLTSYHEWKRAWDKEVADAPRFSTDRLYCISGLLMPVWTAMEQLNTKVYRINLENGERLLGRIVDAADLKRVSRAMGLKATIDLAPHEIFHTVLSEGQTIELGGGFALRRSFVQGFHRLEITGNLANVIDRFEQFGCFREIISWKTRLFVPTDDSGVRTLERVMSLLRH